jgi:iron complex outermembrane receptor protein
MDERKNKIFNTSLSYGDNKIYFNYTDHLMDNQLRESNMLMVTEANNLTIGAVGDYYEFYFRNWNADNIISSPTMTIENKMMPEVNMYSASVHHRIDFDKITVSGRAGIVHHSVGDENRLPFYQTLFPDADVSRWFPIFGLSANYSTLITDSWGAGVLVEASSEAPETEYMFIAVKKLMNKPTWSGNPTLNQPLRATVRGTINYLDIRLEAFATRVWNYVHLTKSMVDENAYLTYENINAYMIGFNFGLSWKFIDMNAGYIFAQNVTKNNPLSEIPPLRVTTILTSPEVYNLSLYIRHSYNDAQTRIDETLKESTTSAWNKVDLGATYSASTFLIALEVNNIMNANYYQHLSYLRNPFASGVQVYEQGTTVRLNIRISQLL